MEDNQKPICRICGKPIEGYGHNAAPIKEGRCCDFCNTEKVLPSRVYAVLRMRYRRKNF